MGRDQKLIANLEDEISRNLNNEQFGVEELASNLGISRSHLHRQLKTVTGNSISQFIREYRLARGLELLKNDDYTVAEVSHLVGFGSASYFTTCFTEYYGYSPGRVKDNIAENLPEAYTIAQNKSSKRKIMLLGSILIAVMFMLALYIYNDSAKSSESLIISHHSVAILPFKNLSHAIDNQYFADGVADAITRNLSGIQDLRVIPRTSTANYLHINQSVPELATKVDVSAFLEGSIQRYDNTIRMEVRLIEAKSGKQIWAMKFDREFNDILLLQSEIAEKVATSLKVQLSPDEISSINQAGTSDPEALDYFMRGNFEFFTFTPEGLRKATNYYEQAIARDPNYALAYTGLANAFMSQASIFGLQLSAQEAMQKAVGPIEKALELDPDLPEAHTWKGFYLLYNNWDFKGAESSYKKGVVNNNIYALMLYTQLLQFQGKHDEALVMTRKILESDPINPVNNMIISLYYTGKYQEAEAYAMERLKYFDDYITNDSYGFLLLNTGRYDEAIAVFHKTIDKANIRYPRMLGLMGAAYAKSGVRDRAMEIIGELKTKRSQSKVGSLGFFIAIIYSALDEKQEAFNWLQAAIDDREMEIPWLKCEPMFYNLHDDVRFQNLLRIVGFPE